MLPSSLDEIASFLDFEPLGLALRQSKFTVTEEVKTLIKIIRAGKDKDAISASRQLHAIIEQQARANGLYATQKRRTLTTNEKGEPVLTETTVKLLQHLRKNSDATQEDIQYGHVIHPALPYAPHSLEDSQQLDPSDDRPPTCGGQSDSETKQNAASDPIPDGNEQSATGPSIGGDVPDNGNPPPG